MEVVAALGFGRLSDKFGRFPCFVAALCLEMINPLYFCLFRKHTSNQLLRVSSGAFSERVGTCSGNSGERSAEDHGATSQPFFTAISADFC